MQVSDILKINYSLIEYTNIYSLTPLAVKQNRTTNFYISSSFAFELNYGSGVEYFCQYGYNSSNLVSPAIIENQKFSCSIVLLIEGKAKISISMKTQGIKKRMTDDEIFNVVSK